MRDNLYRADYPQDYGPENAALVREHVYLTSGTRRRAFQTGLPARKICACVTRRLWHGLSVLVDMAVSCSCSLDVLAST